MVAADLDGVGDVRVWLRAARVVANIAFRVQSHQRPFVVGYVVGQVSVIAHLVQVDLHPPHVAVLLH